MSFIAPGLRGDPNALLHLATLIIFLPIMLGYRYYPAGHPFTFQLYKMSISQRQKR